MSKANLVVLVWVFRLWLRPLSLFASLLFLVGETQIWLGDLRVVVAGGVFFSFVSRFAEVLWNQGVS